VCTGAHVGRVLGRTRRVGVEAVEACAPGRTWGVCWGAHVGSGCGRSRRVHRGARGACVGVHTSGRGPRSGSGWARTPDPNGPAETAGSEKTDEFPYFAMVAHSPVPGGDEGGATTSSGPRTRTGWPLRRRVTAPLQRRPELMLHAVNTRDTGCAGIWWCCTGAPGVPFLFPTARGVQRDAVPLSNLGPVRKRSPEAVRPWRLSCPDIDRREHAVGSVVVADLVTEVGDRGRLLRRLYLGQVDLFASHPPGLLHYKCDIRAFCAILCG